MPFITLILTELFNLSLLMTEALENWLTAVIYPIFKNNGLEVTEKHHSDSLTSLVCIELESVMKEAISFLRIL